MSVLLTRPEADSREVAEDLARIGLESRIWPLTRIERAPGPVEVPEGTEGLLFTSGNTVRAFAEANRERGLPALCVGARTAVLAREAGFARVQSAEGDAQALARLAAGSGLRRLFHPRGRDARAELAAFLAPVGVTVTDRVIYAAEPTGAPPADIAEAFAAGAIRVVTFWSPRHAALFRDLWRSEPLADPGETAAAAISPDAAAPLASLGFTDVLVADRPERRAMIEAIRRADAALRR